MVKAAYIRSIDLLIKAKLKLILGHNLNLGNAVLFKDWPIINIRKDTKLTIGKKTKINSHRHSYHLNMFTPCKIMMDKKGAEIIIGSNSRIHGTCIHAKGLIRIGSNCLIAANTQIMDNNGHDLSMENVKNRINTIGAIKPVIIEDCVWIGTGVVVLPGVTIGKGSVVTANSVVTKDIPAMCLAGGNPAVIIKNF